jgi:hypothetical protein
MSMARRQAEYTRKYRLAHHAERLAYDRRYRQAHRGRILAYQSDRYADSKAVTPLAQRIARLMLDPAQYTLQALGVRLRPYQAEPLVRIQESIERHLGDSFVLLFPRQSGKDELLVNLTLYLADLYSVLPVTIVHVNPTYRPQTEAAVQRFDQAAHANLLSASGESKSGCAAAEPAGVRFSPEAARQW